MISNLRKQNHFVPALYLKHWANNQGKVWRYRLLVSHENVPIWQLRSVRAVNKQLHLYSQKIALDPEDTMERWFDREFESPAAQPFERAITDRRLTSDDWARLIRFVALQDVRTPARLLELLRRWREELPETLNEGLKESVAELEKLDGDVESVEYDAIESQAARLFPGKVTIEENESGGGELKFETVIGRSLWLFMIRYLMTKSIDVLLQQRWTVLLSPADMEWVTSDNPLVRLNYYRDGRHDLKGGWGQEGSEIFMPIGPRHLIYTQVGNRPPSRGTTVSIDLFTKIRNFCIENAEKSIFAARVQHEIEISRPRIVSHGAWKVNEEQWRRWNIEQSEIEAGFRRPQP